MVIGLDFDNTIVCYDGVFHRVAVERGLIPPHTGRSKVQVKEYLCGQDREIVWTELQGSAYGPGMHFATPYPGVREAVSQLRQEGHEVFVVSHKTRVPYLGEPHDLHAAAWEWLERNAFFEPGGTALERDHVFLEVTKLDKLARIAALGCELFVDDLPEFLLESRFPEGVRRVLFDPTGVGTPSPELEQLRSWTNLLELLD